jgi:acyl dehydratase
VTGRYFEEWTVGDQIDHAVRRTVTETDNLLFSALTHNLQPLHLDAEAARQSEFGQILVNSIFTFGLLVGVTVADTTAGTLVANLGFEKVAMPSPVFIGDTLHAQSEVTAIRPSKSRPGQGIVTWRHVMLNQRDEIVCECLRSALVQGRGTPSS